MTNLYFVNSKDFNNGIFLCPDCKSEINPNKSETYKVLEYSCGGSFALRGITIICSKCESRIRLTGFKK